MLDAVLERIPALLVSVPWDSWGTFFSIDTRSIEVGDVESSGTSGSSQILKNAELF